MICENCRKEHDGSYASGRFCGKECAKGFSTKSNRKEINKKVSITLGGTGELKIRFKNCLVCGTQLKQGARKFCSDVCNSSYIKEQYNLRVETNKKFIDSVSNTKRPKQYLIEKYGHQCMICKNTEWLGRPIPLVFDHIDGDSDNWNLNNCRIICHNCNAQTPTFSGKNVGKGRHITTRSILRKHKIAQ